MSLEKPKKPLPDYLVKAGAADFTEKIAANDLTKTKLEAQIAARAAANSAREAKGYKKSASENAKKADDKSQAAELHASKAKDQAGSAVDSSDKAKAAEINSRNSENTTAKNTASAIKANDGALAALAKIERIASKLSDGGTPTNNQDPSLFRPMSGAEGDPVAIG